MNVWIFGYGSLIWRPDFEFLSRQRARIEGWQRRFWQGSHDHRGVPARPGRVVTLVPDTDGICDGVAYLVDRDVAEATFAALDHREKNGYQRHTVLMRFRGDPPLREPAPREAEGVVYVAPHDNHAFLGPAPAEAIARQILTSEGPSGRNVDYLLDLARALRELDAHDTHVFELEALVRSLG